MIALVLEHPRVRSEKRFNDIANTPLWSCLMGGYAAACLEQAGHDVHFVDTTKNDWGFDRTQSYIMRVSPALLCINAVYFWEHTPKLFDFISGLRSVGFEGHVNLFGFFPTLAYHAILREAPSVDSITVGECEHTLTDLAERLSNGKDWKDVPGLAYRTSRGIGMASPRIPERNPDGFPFPFRDPGSDTTASILASRGCYNHCSFCPIPVFYHDGALWRARSPGNVVEEMTRLIDQGFRDFYFVDPNFIGPGSRGKSRILDMAALIRPLGITFGMETRSNDLDKEVLEHLASAGLQSLLLGIESASPSVLGNLRKSSSGHAGERAINLCRSVGIEPEVGFLMFVPDSTVDDLEQNLEFLQRNNLLDRLDRTANLLCHCQIVLMGTSGYRLFKEQGRLIESGLFGFEGDVSYRDARVKWMSELVVHACLYVLQDMSRTESPIYWRTPRSSSVSTRVNDYLVDLFRRLLTTARQATRLPPTDSLKTDLECELQEMILRGANGSEM